MHKLRIWICLFFTIVAFGVRAQNNIAQLPDSTFIQTNDTLVIEASLDDIQQKTSKDSKLIISAQDTIISSLQNNTSISVSKEFKPDPKKAVIYSAIFPGLGQIYNKKYWKLPILYGGFVGVSYAISWNNSHYIDYLQGYRDIIDENPNTNRWHDLLPYGRDPESVDEKWFAGVLKDRKNYFRYYRDLSIIIGVALYGLGIVDAYVDAQLFDFDISSDLSLRVEPVIMKNEKKNYLADSYGFKCSFSF